MGLLRSERGLDGSTEWYTVPLW